MIGALVLTVLDLVFVGFGLSGAMKQVLLGVILVSVYGRESHVSASVWTHGSVDAERGRRCDG